MEQLTADELKFLEDRTFLLTKGRIHGKVVSTLGRVESALQIVLRQVSFPFPEGTFLKAGKISRGENYQGLPYWVLDYPRKFTAEETFAFRTMVWWGHEISCTLHVSGPILTRFVTADLPAQSYFCVNSSPWEYHFENDNYLPLSQIKSDITHRHIQQRQFVKVAQKWPLQALDQLPELATTYFQKMLICAFSNQ